jgi:hypothetical protein
MAAPSEAAFASALRSAATLTLRLLSSTTWFGQTRAVSSSLLTSSPPMLDQGSQDL